MKNLARLAPPTEDNTSLGSLIKHHVLGVISRLGDILNDIRDQHTIPEKKRCIKAIEEIIKIGKASTRTARPQVCISISLKYVYNQIMIHF